VRSILFRGKTYNKKWVEGYFVCLNETPKIISENGISFDVLKNTVSQYTGLKDKNGQKVFEGDIIQFIAYDSEKKCYYKIKEIIDFKLLEAADDMDLDSYGYHINPYWNGNFEVIGNKWDNPELLKEIEYE